MKRRSAPLSLGRGSPADDAGRDSHHVTVQLVGHEWQCDQHRGEDRENLRNEHDGLFLDLRQRLEQRHDQADDEGDDE